MKACQYFQWNHDTSTPSSHRTNSVAERARPQKWKKEQLSQQCKVDYQKCWDSVMECYCYLHKRAWQNGRWQDSILTKDLVSKFDGPSIPFGTLVQYFPFTAKDKWRIHQFGQKTLKGRFLGYVLPAGEVGQLTWWWQVMKICKNQKSQKSTSKDPTTKKYS